MKPLVYTQEKGMLLQAPLGKYTSFLYDNAVMIGHYKYLLEQVKKIEADEARGAFVQKYIEDMFDGSDKEKQAACELALLGEIRNNSQIGATIDILRHQYQFGVKGFQPSANFADAMALTEANYNGSDFKMPYPCIVFELPDECCDRLMGTYDKNNERDIQYLREFGIDESAIDLGFKIKYVVLNELKIKPEYFQPFDAWAERMLEIVVLPETFFSGKLIRSSKVPNKLRIPFNFNPTPVCVFARPLIDNKSVEEVLALRTFNVDTSPGSFPLDLVKRERAIGIDSRIAADTELEYITRITRMAVNSIYALTKIGFDEQKRVASKKLIERGSENAKRVIPDVLSPVAILQTEASRVRYEDNSTGDSGIVKAPHFRRGHWRRQHHGKDRQEVKTIWIAPLVVNRHLLRSGAEDNVIKNVTTQTSTS